MSASSGPALRTRFESAGSLDPPGPIGRGVRLLLGAICLRAALDLWSAYPALARAVFPDDLVWWLGVLLMLWATPYVVNIGLGVDWGGWPRVAVILLILGGMVASWSATDVAWSAPLGAVVWGWELATLAWLGASLVLAAVIATPGCEMRAFPHLWTLATGWPTREHFCPGPLRGVDLWESRRRGD